jgi:ribosome-associated protein
MQIFEIKDDYIELNKLLKVTGFAETGGMANNFIEDGMVSVDGVVESRKRRKVKNEMVVEINNRKIKVIQI